MKELELKMTGNFAPPLKRGQKGYEFPVTPEVLAEIEDLTGKGMTQQQIHYYYGMSGNTWYKLVRKKPEIREALNRGKPRAYKYVVGKLMELIEKGCVAATIFWLKTQGGWAEKKDKIEQPTDEEKEKLKLTTQDPIEASKIYQKLMRN